MDYKLRQCKIDYFEARDYLRFGGEFDKFEYLGSTRKAEVRGYKGVAVKRENLYGSPYWPLNHCVDVVDKRNKLSKKAIKRKINCAPFFGHLTVDDCLYGFMPKLDGVALDNKEALPKLTKLGAHGIEQYFDDYMNLWNIGFSHESDIYTNFLVSDNAVNIIDLNIVPKRQPDRASALAYAAIGLCHKFYKSGEKEMRDELFNNAEKAVEKQKAHRIAQGYLNGQIKTGRCYVKGHFFDDELRKAGFIGPEYARMNL